MELLPDKDTLRDWIASRGRRRRVLVPTMGALHRGHASLLDIARESGDEVDVVASIFVNPTQFGPNEDLDAYPRQLEEDLALCESHGVAAVFHPSREGMYRPDASVTVTETRLSAGLCGASRPVHFGGVCTVVAKLFLLVQPHAAVFGEKDFQQLAVIRRLVRDLDFPVEILPGPTVREDDGLALSSRNAYLSAEERAEAPVIFRALSSVARDIAGGTLRDPGEARRVLAEEIATAPLARVDYAEIVDSTTLEALDSFAAASPRLLAAVSFGGTRLIDNVGLPALNGDRDNG